MNVVPGLRILRTPALIFKTEQSDLELLVLWVLSQNLRCPMFCVGQCSSGMLGYI